jgi:1,4-dihydroxy-6-naphthoate synthase
MSCSERPVLQLGHSPDADDVFMWWPLFQEGAGEPPVRSERFGFVPVRDDIEAMNRRALVGDLEITAISCAHYAAVSDRYVLTSCGASVGDGYGPKIVARAPMRCEDLHGKRIAVPGLHTTAYTALAVLLGPGTFEPVEVPFEQIADRVADATFEAGLVIHEAQLIFQRQGLHLVGDVGQLWSQQFQLPLPLGANVVRRDLERLHGPGALAEVASTLLRSVQYAMEHRDASIRRALEVAGTDDATLTGEFVDLYVNRWSLQFGDAGLRAVGRLLDEAHRAGLIPAPGPVEVVDPVVAST